jgi:quinol monooxygenase YgiN
MIKFIAAPGKRDELAQHLSQTAQLWQSEPGTLLWTVHLSPIEPESVWVYEVYSSPEAKAAHETGDAYAAARAGTNALLGGPPEVFPLIPLGGKGL